MSDRRRRAEHQGMLEWRAELDASTAAALVRMRKMIDDPTLTPMQIVAITRALAEFQIARIATEGVDVRDTRSGPAAGGAGSAGGEASPDLRH